MSCDAHTTQTAIKREMFVAEAFKENFVKAAACLLRLSTQAHHRYSYTISRPAQMIQMWLEKIVNRFP